MTGDVETLAGRAQASREHDRTQAGGGRLLGGLARWWADHGPLVVRVAVVLMATAAATRLAIELWRLLGNPSRHGAVDLRARHEEIGWWFGNLPVWRDEAHAGYPPATFVVLWPLLGWLPLAPARWLWAVLNLGLMGLAVRFVVRESGAPRGRERWFIALLVPACYPVPLTLGNGQLGLVALGAVLAAIFLLEAPAARTWRRDLLVAALLLVALVKPGLTAAFFLIVLFRGRALRPLALAAAGYAALTALALAFRHQPLLADLRAFLDLNAIIVGKYGHSHIPIWLANLGCATWSSWVSLAAFLALVVWVARNRRAELWLLLGVTCLAGRIATYHGVYDDSMTLLALLALYRIAKQPSAGPGRTVAAGLLLALMLLPLLAPISLSRMGLPWSFAHRVFLPAAWLATMLFLAREARRGRAESSSPRAR